MGMSLFLSSAFMCLCGNVLLLSVPKVTVNNPDSDKGGGIAITNKNTYNEKIRRLLHTTTLTRTSTNIKYFPRHKNLKERLES